MMSSPPPSRSPGASPGRIRSSAGGPMGPPSSSSSANSSALRQIPIVCPGHSRPLAEVQYSPITSDGFFLISACHDKLPMLRRGDTGDWIGTFEGHKGAVWSAKVDAKAEFAATGSADFSAKLWDAISGDLVTTFEHHHVVKSVEFSPSGRFLLTCGHEKLLRVFDVSEIKDQWNECKKQGGVASLVPLEAPEPIAQMNCREQIRKVVCLSDQIAVTGEVDGNISVWDLDKAELISEFDVGAGVMDMESSRNGTVLTVAAGKKVFFFDALNEFNFLRSYMMPISFAEEGGVSLHPKDDRFIAGGSDTWVRVFDFQSGDMLECHKGHHGPVRCLRYAPMGESFATGSEDGTIRIWQTDPSSAAANSVSELMLPQ